jgi:hypothetical protein
MVGERSVLYATLNIPDLLPRPAAADARMGNNRSAAADREHVPSVSDDFAVLIDQCGGMDADPPTSGPSHR